MASNKIFLLTFALLLICLLDIADAGRGGKRKRARARMAHDQHNIQAKAKEMGHKNAITSPKTHNGTESPKHSAHVGAKVETQHSALKEAHINEVLKAIVTEAEGKRVEKKDDNFDHFLTNFAGKLHLKNVKHSADEIKKEALHQRNKFEALYVDFEMAKLLHHLKKETPKEFVETIKKFKPTPRYGKHGRKPIKVDVTHPAALMAEFVKENAYKKIEQGLVEKGKKKLSNKEKPHVNANIRKAMRKLKAEIDSLVKEYEKHHPNHPDHANHKPQPGHSTGHSGNSAPSSPTGLKNHNLASLAVKSPSPIHRGPGSPHNLIAPSNGESFSRNSSGNSSSGLPEPLIDDHLKENMPAMNGDMDGEDLEPERRNSDEKLKGNGADMETDPIGGTEQTDDISKPENFGKFEADESTDEDNSLSEIKKDIDETNEPKNDEIQKERTSEDTDPIKLPSSVVDDEQESSIQTKMADAEGVDEQAEKLASSTGEEDEAKTKQKMREGTTDDDVKVSGSKKAKNDNDMDE